MATQNSTKRCQKTDNLEPILRRKSVKKCGKLWKFSVNYVFVLSLICLIQFEFGVAQQFQYPYPPGWERDPRFYSREGVNYNPPNPGEENYR